MKHVERPNLPGNLVAPPLAKVDQGSVMVKKKATADWGPTARSVFDGQLNALMGVLGHEFGPNELRKVDIANCLGIDATGLSQRLSGRTRVSPQEYAKLIDKFGLSAKGIDFSIFEMETREEFLSALRTKNVGTFDGTGASLLRRQLKSLTQENKSLSLEIRRVPMRGLELPSAVGFEQTILRRAEKVQIRVRSSLTEGCVGIFETPLAARLNFRILAPSSLAHSTSLDTGKIDIPATENTDHWFAVGAVPGPHRLFAVQAPKRVIDFLFDEEPRDASGDKRGLHSLSDERQRDFRNLLKLKEQRISAASLDYVVV